MAKVQVERLSEKSLGGLWSMGFGSATLQEQVLCAPFQQFESSSIREFDSFQKVSLSNSANYLESRSCGECGFVYRRSTRTIAVTAIVLLFGPRSRCLNP